MRLWNQRLQSSYALLADGIPGSLRAQGEARATDRQRLNQEDHASRPPILPAHTGWPLELQCPNGEWDSFLVGLVIRRLERQPMSSSHRRFTADQQTPFVRWHLANKESVSTLAEKFGLQPGQIHLWVNQLLAGVDKSRIAHLAALVQASLRPHTINNSKPENPSKIDTLECSTRTAICVRQV